MNLMKNALFCMSLFAVIGLNSCKKDCVAPSISENLVSTWTSNLSGVTIEFKSDGTYIDNEEALLGIEINGVAYTERSYSVSGTTLTLTVMPPSGNGESSTDYEVTTNECDEVVLAVDFLGIDINETLNRK